MPTRTTIHLHEEHPSKRGAEKREWFGRSVSALGKTAAVRILIPRRVPEARTNSKMQRFTLIAAASFGLASMLAHAQSGWEPEMDLLTTGAAASVVLHHACAQPTQAPLQLASQRLRDASRQTDNPQYAYQYAEHAFEMKVKALWQSSGGECRSKRLRDIATSTGFSLPK
jgi:hypothetical protein